MLRHFDFDQYGRPVGWALMGTGTVVAWLADHGMSLFGVGLGLFGAWLHWKTYKMREIEHRARMKAYEAKPCATPTSP
jgi:hypothetical protein